MSNTINTSNPYFYLNTNMNANNVLPTNPLVNSQNTSDVDNSITNINGDSVQISPNALNSYQGLNSNNMLSSVLNNLASNNTITQDQENSIVDAFKSARNSSRTYSNSSKGGFQSPLNQLVSNGAITQTQANDIANAFKSAHQSNKGTTQVSGVQGQSQSGMKGVHHHHHHHGQGAQNATETDPLTSNTDNIGSLAQSLSGSSQLDPRNILDSLVSNGTLSQSQETSIENVLNSLGAEDNSVSSNS